MLRWNIQIRSRCPTVKLTSVDGNTQLTLNIEHAEQYTITIVNDESEEHGTLTGSYPEGITYAGKTVHVDWEAEEGYRLKELIVTTEDGRRVESAFADFRMPSSNVTVSARFGNLYPVTISYPEGIYPNVIIGGLICMPEEARAMEGETVTMYIHWNDGYIPESISVTAAGGAEIPAVVYKEEQNGCICCSFTMPEEAVNVSITAVKPDWRTADFILPAAVTRIEEEAFERADMHAVYIPDSCASIGARAFMNCRNMHRIRIPARCTIGDGAFDGCGMVFVYGTAGSPAESYCSTHRNCVFMEE